VEVLFSKPTVHFHPLLQQRVAERQIFLILQL
jgi:hypothetical protein